MYRPGVDHDEPGPAQERSQHGLTDFVYQAAHGTLPAVTFLKPGNDDGHPGYSTLYAYDNKPENVFVGLVHPARPAGLGG